jgi:hypothetical protein
VVERLDVNVGHPDNPLSLDQVAAKFRDNAAVVLGELGTAGVIALVWDLPATAPGELARALVAPANIQQLNRRKDPMTERYAAYKFLAFDRPAERVLRITINRPEKLNSLPWEAHGELTRVWLDVDQDPDTERVASSAARARRSAPAATSAWWRGSPRTTSARPRRCGNSATSATTSSTARSRSSPRSTARRWARGWRRR